VFSCCCFERVDSTVWPVIQHLGFTEGLGHLPPLAISERLLQFSIGRRLLVQRGVVKPSVGGQKIESNQSMAYLFRDFIMQQNFWWQPE